MNEVDYRYELDQGVVAIETLRGGYSVIIEFDQIVTHIEREAGPLVGKHFLCQGQDGYWDLLLPVARQEPKIYPLSALTLGEAKAKLARLIASGQL